MGGEALAAARLDWRGVGGDRAHALLDRRGSRGPLADGPAGAAAAGLVGHHPDAPDDRLDPADPPPPRLRAPDGTAWGWDDPAWTTPWPPISAWPWAATSTWRASRTSRRRSWSPRRRPGGRSPRPWPPGRAAALPHQPAPGAGRAGVRRGALGGRPAPGRRGHPGLRPPLRLLRDPDPRPRRPEPLAGAAALAAPPPRGPVRGQRPGGGWGTVRVGDPVTGSRSRPPPAEPRPATGGM